MTIQSFRFDRLLIETFLDFRDELYRGDAGWMPQPRSVARAPFLPDFNFHRPKGNDHQHFLATARGRVTGHVTASFSPDRVDQDGHPVGALGYFECIDESAVAADLLGAASTWLKAECGISLIWAPLNFDIWHSYRLMTSGFQETPFLGEPHNKPYYPCLLERSGFAKRHNWISAEISSRGELEKIAAESKGRHDQLVSAGYRFGALDLTNDLGRRRLHAAEMAAFRNFIAYTPCAYDDFDAMLRAYLQITSGCFSFIVSDPHGNDVGFSLAYPDREEGVGSAEKRAVFYMIGATPAQTDNPRGLGWARQHGIGRGLFYFTLQNLLAAGLDRIVFALITNEAQGRHLLGEGMQQGRRSYALYELTL